jgi:hypothetical protein
MRIKCLSIYRVFVFAPYQYLRKSTTDTESQQRCESDKLCELQLSGSGLRALRKEQRCQSGGEFETADGCSEFQHKNVHSYC